jgi:fibronectin-binding autotransporter adhesin
LTVNGSGTMLFLASNTYTGATTLAGGTLQVGNGGSGASIGATSSIVNNGTLIFDHSDAVTLAAPISGDGDLIQQGTGRLVLAGGNSYSGGTLVSSGELTVDSPAALDDGSSLTVGLGAATIFDPAGAAPAGVAAVPEPNALVLLVAAGLGTAVVRRRYRRQQVPTAGMNQSVRRV